MNAKIVSSPDQSIYNKIVETDSDYQITNLDRVIVASPGVTLTFPPNAVLGQSHKILALAGSGPGVEVVGGVSGPATVPPSSAADFVFGGSGQWDAVAPALTGGGPFFGDDLAGSRAYRRSSLVEDQDHSAQVLALGFNDTGGIGTSCDALGVTEGKVYAAGFLSGTSTLLSVEKAGYRIETLGTFGSSEVFDVIAFGLSNNTNKQWFVAALTRVGINVFTDGNLNGESALVSSFSPPSGETWDDGRMTWGYSSGPVATMYWTAPTTTKVYAGKPGSTASQVIINTSVDGSSPRTIEIADEVLWVSYVTGPNVNQGVLRRFQIDPTNPASAPLQLGSDIDVEGEVLDLVFDGNFMWAIRVDGTVFKFSQDGKLVLTTSVLSSVFIGARTRLAWDGSRIWATGVFSPGNAGYQAFDPDSGQVTFATGPVPGEMRGIAVDENGVVYMANSLIPGTNCFLNIWYPPRGGRFKDNRSTSYGQTNDSSIPASSAILVNRPIAWSNFGQCGREFLITTVGQAQDGGYIWSKQRIRVDSSGSVIPGDPVQVDDSPKRNAIGTVNGMNVVISIASGNLQVQVNQVDSVGTTKWSVTVEERRADFGTWT
jgi:hypothetical protein